MSHIFLILHPADMVYFIHMSNSENIYRVVIADAFKIAWREKRFWPLSLFAFALLSMASFDVIFVSAAIIKKHAATGHAPAYFEFIKNTLHKILNLSHSVLGLFSFFQFVTVVAILVIAAAVFSCICQGALVYALGSMRRGDRVSIRTALQFGVAALTQVGLLNVFSILSLFLIRFLAGYTLYLILGLNQSASWFIYIFSFLVFLVVLFGINIIQIFALNAMVLQGAPLMTAIKRGYDLFRKHWLITIETALLLLIANCLLGIVLSIVISILQYVASIFILTSAVVMHSYALYIFFIVLSWVAYTLCIFSIAAFIVQLQYATWILLYRKMGEGGIVAKLHRVYRDITGTYRIPKN